MKPKRKAKSSASTLTGTLKNLNLAMMRRISDASVQTIFFVFNRIVQMKPWCLWVITFPTASFSLAGIDAGQHNGTLTVGVLY